MSDANRDKPRDESADVERPGADASGEAEQGKGEEARPEESGAKTAKPEAEGTKNEVKEAWETDPQTPEWAEADADPLVEALRATHGEALRSARRFAGDLVLEIDRDEIREVCRSLKEQHEYPLFVDLCGAHYPSREESPLEIVYHLYSREHNSRVRLKVRTADGQEVPSVTPVYGGANWAEREAYDMYGIRFSEHPDLTRILMWEGFNGHPLRKEFPLEGVDTGAAIYPEYYGETSGPVAGTGTGWKPPAPTAEPESDEPGDEDPR